MTEAGRGVKTTSTTAGKPVRTPELAELRAFCAAIDLGSIGKAARLLRISQPALSKRLRGLEKLTGSNLLDRSPQGVSPTPVGEQLYGASRRLLEEAERVEALMDGLSSDPAPVRLAASPTIAEFVLPPLLVDLERRHQHHLSVELSIANSCAVRALVLEGRADLGVTALDPSDARATGLCEEPFCADEVVVAVPESHPWAALERIALAEFVTTRMIMRDPGADSRRAVSEQIETLGLSLAPPLAEIGSTTAAIATAIAEGEPVLLSSLALSLLGESDLVVRRVGDLRFHRRFVLIHSAEEGLPGPARSLVRHLLEVLEPLPSRPDAYSRYLAGIAPMPSIPGPA
jgi:DNA-binding transcriptional LysR family regulator